MHLNFRLKKKRPAKSVPITENENMSELKQAKCEACRADAPRVSDEELAQLMHQIPDWTPVRARRHFAIGA